MAQIAVVLFLQVYRDRFNSIEDYRFQRAFSYAVYAYLHIQDSDERERKNELENKYGKRFVAKLEQVSQETMLVDYRDNSHRTRQLLQKCLAGQHEEFSKDIIREIASFLPIRA